MNVVFRTDASVSLGSGHLMRCLTLADELTAKGCNITFICRDLPGNLFPLLEQKGYPVCKLPAPSGGAALDWEEDAEGTIHYIKASIARADWMIVDHYELDARWESSLRTCAKRIMAIDDLANRAHDSDLLLDQNYYSDLDTRYDELVPENCLKLLGPKYVLLRPEFRREREHLRKRDGHVRRILVFFGGSDSTNQTRKALEAIKLLKREIAVDVVVGASNPHRNEIQSLCEELPNVQYYCQVSNMAELIAAADIAIGAGGATTWERCSLGLPTLTVVFAENQLQTTLDLEKLGAIEFLGWASQLAVSDLASAIERLIQQPDQLKNLSEQAGFVMKNWRGAGTIIAAMKNTSTN